MKKKLINNSQNLLLKILFEILKNSINDKTPKTIKLNTKIDLEV